MKPGRIIFLLLSVALLWATLAPGFHNPRKDDYPFSTYPMFAAKRKAPWFSVVEGVDREGRVRRLPPEIVAGNDEIMQAAAVAKRATRSSKRARGLCRKVRARAQASDTHQDLVKFRVVRVQFDPLTYFAAEAKPRKRKVCASCSVRTGAKK